MTNITALSAAAKAAAHGHVQTFNLFASSSVLAVGCIMFAAIIIGIIVFKHRNGKANLKCVSFPNVGCVIDLGERLDYRNFSWEKEEFNDRVIGQNSIASGSWSQPLIVMTYMTIVVMAATI
jgi:hypothetical protein